MISNEDVQLSNMSYTDKDFASIWPDLLDLAAQLTDKLNPSTSNESDPGVVLLKEGAFIADHLNYNIDKNTLEAFLPSATQETSARNIAEINGYSPRYYVSASGNINFTYSDDSTDFAGFSIAAFTLVVTKEDGTMPYTQVSPLVINAKNVAASCKFIEGTLAQLTTEGSDTILLSNLDDNRRIYFPNRYVASNGVFIKNTVEQGINQEYWTRVDLLQTQPLNSRVYKVDFDSNLQLPYIEFPSDIARIIKSGLEIKYIVTSGADGNVKAGELTSLSANSVITDTTGATRDASNFTVVNQASFLSGQDPESIDEIYKSFMNTVGTFDTLVTCNDYTNAIKNLTDDNSYKLVSNAVVSDRTNDYSKAINIVTKDASGIYYQNASICDGPNTYTLHTTAPASPKVGDIKYVGATSESSSHFEVYTAGNTWADISSLSYKEFSAAAKAMSPYDLSIRALSRYSDANYTSSHPERALNKSYEAILSSDSKLTDLKSGVEDNKSIVHTWNDLKAGDIAVFKNYVPLHVLITPFYKVTKLESADIINNIYKALSKKFNASQVQFGEELDYDQVYDCILTADSRINKISMSEFSYNTKAVQVVNASSGLALSEQSVNETSDIIVDLVAKNVLSGHLRLFDYSDVFYSAFGQKTNGANSVYNNVASISTNVDIPNSEIASGYTVRDNEYIHITWQSYASKEVYPAYVYYRYYSDGSGTATTISANEDHRLLAGEHLCLQYTSDNVVKTDYYNQGDIIQPTFELVDTSSVTGGYNKTYIDPVTGASVTAKFISITGTNQIAHRVKVESTVKDSNVPCYLIMSNSGNILFDTNETEVILSSNEYFMYADSALTSYTLLGAGTKLTRGSGLTDQWSIPTSEISIASLVDQGLSSDINLQYKDFSLDNKALTISEMNILTLAPGAVLTVIGSSEGVLPATIDNSWRTFVFSSCSYTSLGQTATLTPNIPDGYKIRSRLDISLSTISGQVLKQRQTVTITYGASATTVVITPASGQESISLQSSYPLELLGDTQTDLSAYADIVNIDLRAYVEDKATVTRTNYALAAGTISSADTLYVNTTSGFESKAATYFPTTSYANLTDYNATEPLKAYRAYNAVETLDIDDEYTISIDSQSQSIRLPYITQYSIESQQVAPKYLVPVYWYKQDEDTSTITFSASYASGSSSTTLQIKEYNKGSFANSFTASESGLYILELATLSGTTVNADCVLSVAAGTHNNKLQILNICSPKATNGLNSNIGQSSATLSSIVARMQALVDNSTEPNTKIYWLNSPEKDVAVENENLADPNSYWDINNVANRITIPQIDIVNSSISVLKSMELS